MGSLRRMDHEKDALLRARIVRFLGDPEASKLIEEMTGAEIALAVRGAFRSARKFLEVDDGAKPLN